jgi:hypothetical protein
MIAITILAKILKMFSLDEENEDCCLKGFGRDCVAPGVGLIVESDRPSNKGLERTHTQRSARGYKMWKAIIILSSESVSESSSSLKR